MASKQTMKNQLIEMTDTVSEKPYFVSGFGFTLENLYDVQAEILEPEKGMPRVNGFVYRFEGVLYGEVEV